MCQKPSAALFRRGCTWRRRGCTWRRRACTWGRRGEPAGWFVTIVSKPPSKPGRGGWKEKRDTERNVSASAVLGQISMGWANKGLQRMSWVRTLDKCLLVRKWGTRLTLLLSATASATKQTFGCIPFLIRYMQIWDFTILNCLVQTLESSFLNFDMLIWVWVQILCLTFRIHVYRYPGWEPFHQNSFFMF